MNIRAAKRNTPDAHEIQSAMKELGQQASQITSTYCTPTAGHNITTQLHYHHNTPVAAMPLSALNPLAPIFEPAPTPTAADDDDDDDDDDAPPADAPPLLPLGSDEFPDEVLAFVCSLLGLRELGRLACAARRFTEPTLTEPGGAKLLSPI
eukprot:COSAG06_NODE_14702_length_1133_cov_9.242747_1_plen_150_part_10